MLLSFISFLESWVRRWKGFHLCAFWHINSSQCKEKGSKWFQIQNRQAVLIRPKLQSAPGTNKERHFLETFYSPIQFWERDSSQENCHSLPQIDWFQWPFERHTVRQETTLPRSLPPGTGKASASLDLSTWHKGRASYTFLLYNL